MSPLLVLTGLIGASSAALPGPTGAIDANPRPAAGQFDAASPAPRGELQPFVGFRAKRPEKRYSVTVPIGKPKPAVALPRIEGPADARLPLVVIDAGHGGHDPGAISP